jgi:hypothetical protein
MATGLAYPLGTQRDCAALGRWISKPRQADTDAKNSQPKHGQQKKGNRHLTVLPAKSKSSRFGYGCGSFFGRDWMLASVFDSHFTASWSEISGLTDEKVGPAAACFQ